MVTTFNLFCYRLITLEWKIIPKVQLFWAGLTVNFLKINTEKVFGLARKETFSLIHKNLIWQFLLSINKIWIGRNESIIALYRVISKWTVSYFNERSSCLCGRLPNYALLMAHQVGLKDDKCKSLRIWWSHYHGFDCYFIQTIKKHHVIRNSNRELYLHSYFAIS